MLWALARKSVIIALVVLLPIFIITLLHLNLFPNIAADWLWKFNWALVAFFSPILFFALLALAESNIKAKKLIEDAEQPKNGSLPKAVAITLSVLGNIVGGIVAIAVFLFLLVATGTKWGQLSIEENLRFSNERSVNTEADSLGLVDVRGEIHVHSMLSWDSKGKLEDIARAAKKNGVRWIIFTDHLGHLPPGNYPDTLDGVTLIYGQERQHRIGGKQCGSALRASLKDPERSLHLYGHIEKYDERGDGDYDRWDGIELVSFHANAREYIGSLLGKLIINPSAFYPELTRPMKKNLNHWQWRAEQEDRPIPIFAAPDAHQNMGILGCQTDPYEFIFKMVSTHIWIEKGEALNQGSIFKAIKQGRTYIAFDYLGDPTGFQFYAVAPGGKIYTGDTVSQPLCLMTRVPPGECKIKFFCNNQQITKGPFFSEGRDWINDPSHGFWRIEVWRNDKPWIISGQILVK